LAQQNKKRLARPFAVERSSISAASSSSVIWPIMQICGAVARNVRLRVMTPRSWPSQAWRSTSARVFWSRVLPRSTLANSSWTTSRPLVGDAGIVLDGESLAGLAVGLDARRAIADAFDEAFAGREAAGGMLAHPIAIEDAPDLCEGGSFAGDRGAADDD